MIRIIAGTYGMHTKSGIVAKNAESDPFKLDAKEEKRLVDLGIAEYVGKAEPSKEAPAEVIEPDTSMEDDDALDESPDLMPSFLPGKGNGGKHK